MPDIRMIATFRARLDELKSTFRDPIGLKGRLLRGVTWSLVGVSLVQAFKLLAAIIIARLLGDVGYGELGMLNSTVVTFGVFSGLGLGVTATKYVAQFRTLDARRAGELIGFLTKLALFTGATMTIAVIFFSPLIADRVLMPPI